MPNNTNKDDFDDKDGIDYEKAVELGLLDDPTIKDRIAETEDTE